MEEQTNTADSTVTEAQSPIQNVKEIAADLGLEYRAQLEKPEPPRDLVYGDFGRIAGSWGRQFKIVPIAGDESKVIVATSLADNFAAIQQLKLCYGRNIQVVMTPESEVISAINAIRTTLMSDRPSELSKEKTEEEMIGTLKIDVTDAEDDDAPIIRYLNAIIFKASKERASDVHIESFEEEVKVRFRIDGRLYDIASEDKSFQSAIISRIKVMAGLNIAEKRLPQDGRIGLKIAGKDVDIRVSTIPTQFGERVVMRLLDKTATVLDLEQVGLQGDTLKLVEKLIAKPNGILLVTGPTGSGKTTTLYSCLSSINTPDKNILTVEDPIEYQLNGIGQMQVNPKINFTFASGLRSILRQDPDVVMVGEIRDGETADIAIQASLTGHLVLSTLHTNDSAGAITRLIDMGAEPFLVSSSLLAVMAQRLVRRLCTKCKTDYDITEEELKELGIADKEISTRKVFKPGEGGCESCQFTGYSGRMGIHELLVINDEIRAAILQRMDTSTIKSIANKYGFMNLRQDGGLKVLMGDTSVEEVLMVTHEDQIGA